MLRVKLFQLKQTLVISVYFYICMQASEILVRPVETSIIIALHGPLGDFVGNVKFDPYF